MRVESEVGKGTTFSFALDFDVMPDQRAGADIGRDDGIARADLLKGVSALVVEENAFDAFVLGRALASWGVTYEVCPTVADGAARLRTNRYDAVLLATRAEQQELESASAALIGAVPSSNEPPQVFALAPSASEAAQLSAGGRVVAILPKPVDTSVLFAKLASSSGL
jgi:CheY-like chemotaxis protein